MTGEVGLSGTTNYLGQLYTEQNPNLINDLGYGRPGTRTWGEWETIVRTDPAVSSALDLIVSKLRDAELNVVAPEGYPNGDVMADFVRENLQDWLDPLPAELLQQMARGTLGYGFSIHETVFETRADKRLPGGFGYSIAQLAQRLPNSLMYNAWIERDGDLAEIRQRGVRNGQFVQDLVLPANKVLLCSWNREGNNYAGYSAFRPVWFPCKVREQLLKIVAIGHQRESCGVPMAVMDKGTLLTPGQRLKLRRLLENIVYHENAAVVLPPGVKLDWYNSPGANKGHVIDTWLKLGVAIMEVLQAQQMSLGTHNTGSRSVGQVHDANKNSFIVGVKANIEGVLNGVGRRPYTGLVRRLIDANWGPQEKYPKVSLTLPSSALEPLDFINGLASAVTASIITWGAEDENDLRDRVGLRPIDPAEREKVQAEKLAQAQAAMKSAADAATSEVGGTNGKASKAQPGGGPAAAPAKVGKPGAAALSREPSAEFVPKRALFAHEKHVDFPAIDQLLSTARDRFEEGARPLLIEMLVRAMPAVRGAMKDGDPSEVSSIVLDTNRLGHFVEAFLEQMRHAGHGHVAAEMKAQPPGQTFRLPSAPTVTAASARISFAKGDAPPFDVEKMMNAQRAMLLRRMSSRLVDDLQRQAIKSVRQGGDPESIVSDVVQNAMETRALRQDAGLVTSSAFNIGREQFAREHGDQVGNVVLSALLDKDTCLSCEHLDGDEYEFGSAEHEAHVPPLTDVCDGGDSCRCILVYEFDNAGPDDQGDDSEE